MFSRLASLEGFSTTSTYLDNQNTYYNKYIPNLIPSTYGPPQQSIQAAITSVNPQNDIQNVSSLFTAPVLISDAANQKNQACAAAPSISTVIDNGATQCGWFYTPPVTSASPIPRYNKGFLAPGGVPAPLPNAPQSTDYTYAYSDQLPAGQKLADGKKRILTDICKSLKTCTDVAKSPYMNLCGFCTDANQGVPVDSNGKALYTGPNVGCTTSVITNATQCPTSTVSTPSNGCVVGQPFTASCLRDALKSTGCDQGTLNQALQGWTQSASENTSKVQNLRAVKNYNRDANPAFDVARYIGSGTQSSQLDAIQEIGAIMSYTGNANTTLQGYAARELCVNPTAIDSFDFCAELVPGTQKPTDGWSLTCLQRAFRQGGGTPSGAMYPTNATSQGTILFNNKSTWGQVLDYITQQYTAARGITVSGFTPSKAEGFVVDMDERTTANRQAQMTGLQNMLGTTLTNVKGKYDGYISITDILKGFQSDARIPIQIAAGPGPAACLYNNGTYNPVVTVVPTNNNPNYTFTLVPALTGTSGYVSLQTNQNTFLRHSGFIFYPYPANSDSMLGLDSSFKPIPALNGDPKMVSFQSINFPDRYIYLAPSPYNDIVLHTVSPTSLTDREQVSWFLRKAP